MKVLERLVESHESFVLLYSDRQILNVVDIYHFHQPKHEVLFKGVADSQHIGPKTLKPSDDPHGRRVLELSQPIGWYVISTF